MRYLLVALILVGCTPPETESQSSDVVQVDSRAWMSGVQPIAFDTARGVTCYEHNGDMRSLTCVRTKP